MRPPCCDKMHVKRGPWSEEEDAKILAHVSKHGTGNWTSVPKKAGLQRCGKSCRLRWTNYLRPELKHKSFSAEEEDLIIKLHSAIGSRWAIIAQQLPGRTDNDIKNYWNTKLKKKLTEKGIDPITHRTFSQILRDYDSIGGVPAQTRAGSISKDLKNAIYAGNTITYSEIPQMVVKPKGCYSLDLLAQLQSIKLLTDGSGSSTLRDSFSPMPTQACFINARCSLPSASSSSSSSSTCSTAAVALVQEKSPPHNFSWSEFLLEEANLASAELVKAAKLSTDLLPIETENGEVGGDGDFRSNCVQAPPSSPSSVSSFVQDMLKRDGDMFMDFPQLWEEPNY